jgi:hypothetical protein
VWGDRAGCVLAGFLREKVAGPYTHARDSIKLKQRFLHLEFGLSTNCLSRFLNRLLVSSFGSCLTRLLFRCETDVSSFVEKGFDYCFLVCQQISGQGSDHSLGNLMLHKNLKINRKHRNIDLVKTLNISWTKIWAMTWIRPKTCTKVYSPIWTKPGPKHGQTMSKSQANNPCIWP